MGALARFEDFTDVFRSESPSPYPVERTSKAAHHAVEKATALNIQSQVFPTLNQLNTLDSFYRIRIVLFSVSGTVAGEVMSAREYY